MSEELSQLRHRMREKKKLLAIQISALTKFVRKGRRRMIRANAGHEPMTPEEIKFVHEMEKRLCERRGERNVLNELTRR